MAELVFAARLRVELVFDARLPVERVVRLLPQREVPLDRLAELRVLRRALEVRRALDVRRLVERVDERRALLPRPLVLACAILLSPLISMGREPPLGLSTER